jgi:hypothetical protein
VPNVAVLAPNVGGLYDNRTAPINGKPITRERFVGRTQFDILDCIDTVLNLRYCPLGGILHRAKVE